MMNDRDQAWREFEAMAKRPLSQRIHYGFVHTYKPVLDVAPYRSFETMEEYRKWCAANLPVWLGFARGFAASTISSPAKKPPTGKKTESPLND
jgi:hypothetical protein